MLDLAEIRIGNNCLIGPDVGIYTAGHRLEPEGRIADVYGLPITIGHDVWIGGHSTILPGVTIGDGAVIGAGSVVSKDIPPYAVAVGCPIEIKRYRLSESQIAAMQRIQWWNWEDEKLKDIKSMFNNIDAFIGKYDK